jgi:hypothetical protein
LTFGDAHLALDPETAIVMSPDATAPSAVLERGAAWFAIAPREGRSFVVLAGDTVVRVIGTKFRVSRTGEHATVEVARGRVAVAFRGTTVEVGAGEQWSSARPAEVHAMRTAAADTTATRRTEGTSRSTPGPLRDADHEADHRAPAPDRDARPAQTDRPRPRPDVRTEDVAERAADARASDRDRLEYERLAGLEARDPAAAIAGYLALSRGRGPWAANALYAAGRLAADRGDPRAATFLSIYLRRFPSGPNAADVRYLLARLKGESK